jgi:hypothetical protein
MNALAAANSNQQNQSSLTLLICFFAAIENCRERELTKDQYSVLTSLGEYGTIVLQ